MKKSLIFLVFVLFLGVLVFLTTRNISWDKLNINSGSSASILDAIPSNTTFFIDVVNPASLDSTLNSKKYGDVLKSYSFFDELLELHDALKPMVKKINPSSSHEYPLRASMHLAQRGQMKGILYYKLDHSSKHFKSFISSLGDTSNLNSWNYNNEQLYDLILLNQKKKIAFAYVDGILIISEISFLVEDAVNELSSGRSLMDVAGMRDLMSTSDNRADIHIYFNYEQADLWLSCFLNNEHVQLLKPLKKFGSWSLLDVFLNNEEIYINGSTAVSKEGGLAKYTQPLNSKAGDFIPNNALFAMQYNFHTLPDNYFLSATRGSQVYFSLLETLDANYQDQLLLYFDLKHPNATLTSLQSESGFNVMDSVKWNGSSIVQGSCSVNSSFLAEFRNLKWNTLHFLLYEDLMVLSANESILSELKSKWIKKEVLSNDEHFNKLFGENGMNGALDIYIRPTYAQELINSIFDAKLLSQSDELYTDLRRFSVNRLTYNKDQNVYRTEGSIIAKEVSRNIGGNVWKIKLDNHLVNTVYDFFDQGTKQYLLLGQDANHLLYCFSATGKILWSKQLDGQIIGRINEADYYKNNKSQLLFNTQNTIYWLSVNGEDVADYPLKLSAPATTGLALFDYDNDKEYRIFIPTSNKNLYGYEASGKPLPGWNPKVEVGIINRPLLHFSHKGKDYIFASNDSDQLMLWNRRGELRLPPIKLSEMNDDYFLDESADPYKLKSVNTSGKIVAADLKGRISSYQLSVSFPVTFSKYANLSSEPKDEILLSDGLTIKCFSHIGKELFIYNLPELTASIFEVVKLSKTNFGLLAYNELSKQCYLINGKGLLQEGFPIKSTIKPRVLDLFGSGDLYVVILNEDGELQAMRLP